MAADEPELGLAPQAERAGGAAGAPGAAPPRPMRAAGRADAAAGFALAQAVCTRLCHDLGGPVGALAGALDLLDARDEDAAGVARDAARILDRRLRFWRAAVGGTTGDLDPEALALLAEGVTLGRRATIALDGLAEGTIAPALSQPLLLAMLVAAEALPRGGVVRVGGGGEGGIVVRPDGPGAAWPPALLALLAGDEPVLTPRGVALPLLAAAAAAGTTRLDLLHAAGALPALLLTPGPA